MFGTDFIRVNGIPIWGYAFTLGISDAENSGNPDRDVIWKGAMVGRFYENVGTESDVAGHRVHGEATLIYRQSDETLDVAITNIDDIDAGITGDEPPPHAHTPMYWEDLKIMNGQFKAGSDGNSIQGQFYGADHQEIAGTLEGSSIAGSFGVRRH